MWVFYLYIYFWNQFFGFNSNIISLTKSLSLACTLKVLKHLNKCFHATHLLQGFHGVKHSVYLWSGLVDFFHGCT